MNEDTFMNKMFQLGMGFLIILSMLLWFGVLIAPIFLPAARRRIEFMYTDFQYKDSLIQEEMARYTRLAWIMCGLGWVATITYFLTVAP